MSIPLFQKARLLIWTGFAMNFFFVTMGALCDWIPGAPYWNNDAGFHAIFGLAPRVAAASFVAFIVGSFANAYVCRCWSRIIVSKGFFNRHRSIDIRFLVKPIRNIDGWGSNYSFYERNKRENKLSLNQTTD